MVVVRLLGPVDVVDSAGTARPLGSTLRRSLLALLALRAGEVLTGDWLLEHTWAGTPPESGLGALRFHISRLRKELGDEDMIETRPGGYRLALSADQVDVLVVEEHVRAARVQTDRGLAADMYAEALAMWRGAPFTDAAPCSVLDDEAARLGELRQMITEDHFQALLDSGAGREIVADLSRATTQHPLRESLWAMLIVAQYRAGRQADALRSYEQMRAMLADSLGLDPSTELQDLQRRVLQHDPSLLHDLSVESDEISTNRRPARESSPTDQPSPTLPSKLQLLANASSFVGRRTELAGAGSVLKTVSAGLARTLLLVGEPGVGKTRLAAAIAADAVARDFTVLYGRCEEGLAAPYQPVVEAFGPWLASCADSALRQTVGRAAAALAQLWPELARRLAVTPWLSGADPQTQRWRLFEAVAELVRSIATERPLMLVVDDIQWAEPSTLLLLAHLVRRAVPGTALVATVRPAESVADPEVLLGDLGTDRPVDVIELAGFDAAEVGELVGFHAGGRPPDALAEQLRRHTDGNPFFLTTLVAHLEDVVFVRNSTGFWVTPGDLETVGVPQGVRAVIGRRLSLLSDAARQALDVAAVAGLAFDGRTVGRVLGAGEETVNALDEAISAGVVREEDAGRYAFVHALMRMTVLDGLSRTRVARLHWRIAEELELDTASARPRTGEIAYHYASGGAIGDPATIVRASVAAGDEARDRVAFEEATNHFRTALAALDRSRPDPDARYRVLTSLGETLNALAEPVDPRPLWLEAAEIARRAGDPEQLFAAILGYAYNRAIGADERAGLVDDLLEMVSTEDSPLRARALGWRAVPIPGRQAAEARLNDLQIADDAVAMARRTGDEDALASTLHSRLLLEAEAPDARAMLSDAEEVRTVGPAPGEAMRRDRQNALWLLTIALLRLGRREQAEEHLMIARQTAERSGLRWAMNESLVLESALATASGRFADGERLAADAAQLGRSQDNLAELGYGAQILASRMEQGRLDEVIDAFRQFDQRADAFPAWRAMLAGALADAGRHSDASAEISPLIDEALSGCTPGIGVALTLRYMPEVCRQLWDANRSAALLAHVLPWAGQILVVSSGGSIEGASDRGIGHLLATLGRYDEAASAYTAAAKLERAAGFLPHVARTEYWHARLLTERHKAHDRETAGRLLDSVIDITERLGMRLLAEQAARLM